MSTPVKLSIVVAMAQNRTIGKENGLPWRLSEDLKYFKKITMGHPIIMGRKTFESIGRPLPGRTNIVVTRQDNWSYDGVKVVHDIDAAISIANQIALLDNKEEIMLIGGAELYKQSINICTRLYLTEVHAEVEGDAFFPLFDPEHWQEISRDKYEAQGGNPYDYSFVVFDRKK
ncbi:dihydrofolate reductase [Agarilytica rhodophyticola]|uniref:dihydrofolate reductase n=1 Tax=Agarilytica rhodophyticola TaxID=1737490 RepID=UPI000B3487E2|nr:dihydrofolate reductase [Agarilytica rhodophyticola]